MSNHEKKTVKDIYISLLVYISVVSVRNGSITDSLSRGRKTQSEKIKLKLYKGTSERKRDIAYWCKAFEAEICIEPCKNIVDNESVIEKNEH